MQSNAMVDSNGHNLDFNCVDFTKENSEIFMVFQKFERPRDKF